MTSSSFLIRIVYYEQPGCARGERLKVITGVGHRPGSAGSAQHSSLEGTLSLREKQMTWKGSCGKMVIAAEGCEAVVTGVDTMRQVWKRCYEAAGGIAHGVGIAKFIIVWDEEGNSRVDKWWVEPWE